MKGRKEKAPPLARLLVARASGLLASLVEFRGVVADCARHFRASRNGVANGLQSNMPKFYCDYCDTYLTHDSPSVRKTHCSGRKHKENVKDYYQKWMEEQAQSLIDKTSMLQSLVLMCGCISTRKDTSYSILCSSSCRGDDTTSPQPSGSSSPWYDASTPYGGPSHDANDGPSSSWDDASGTWFPAWASCSPFLQLRTNA
ncbi:U1 small nuclear ribonucleoprotein C isoform X5 [Macaca fascicularis]|uniref:U1 small nuclear ribonucleoprotein C isoform X5 n=1 Tax=Macaca fascicularis TaxID=9541 RepID=UPI0032B07611